MNTRQRLCLSFPEFRYRLNFQISTSEKIANIFAVERDGKSVIVLIVVLGLASEVFLTAISFGKFKIILLSLQLV